MPLYEYHCSSCDIDFEQLIFDGDEPACPKCGGSELTKLVTTAAIDVKNSWKQEHRKVASVKFPKGSLVDKDGEVLV